MASRADVYHITNNSTVFFNTKFVTGSNKDVIKTPHQRTFPRGIHHELLRPCGQATVCYSDFDDQSVFGYLFLQFMVCVNIIAMR